MPKIMDIATFKTGKDIISSREVMKRYYAPLTLKNQMRTSFTIHDASKQFDYRQLYAESKGVYASWCDKLNHMPEKDCFSLLPLNKVKEKNTDDMEGLDLEIKHRKWLEKINYNIERLKIRKSVTKC